MVASDHARVRKTQKQKGGIFMKKLFAWLLVLLLVVPMIGVASASATEKKDELVEVVIKGHRFGDSKQSVMDAEGEPIGNDFMTGNIAEYIYYNASIVGLDAYLVYYFTDEGLCEMRYLLNEDHSNESLYIEDYNKVKEALITKYGEPVSLISGEHWDTNSHKDYYKEKKGDALSYGYLTYDHYFLVKDAEIDMHMSADNYDVSTSISYVSLTIKKPEPDYGDDI